MQTTLKDYLEIVQLNINQKNQKDKQLGYEDNNQKISPRHNDFLRDNILSKPFQSDQNERRVQNLIDETKNERVDKEFSKEFQSDKVDQKQRKQIKNFQNPQNQKSKDNVNFQAKKQIIESVEFKSLQDIQKERQNYIKNNFQKEKEILEKEIRSHITKDKQEKVKALAKDSKSLEINKSQDTKKNNNSVAKTPAVKLNKLMVEENIYKVKQQKQNQDIKMSQLMDVLKQEAQQKAESEKANSCLDTKKVLNDKKSEGIQLIQGNQ